MLSRFARHPRRFAPCAATGAAGAAIALRARRGTPWQPGAVSILCCFLLFLAAWTAFGSLGFAGKAIHGDVAEAYAWGREFRLGYNQHPPFWAWIAGAWFLLFPHRDWAFNLLAVLNSAIGLLGAWRLIGLFATGERRLGGFLLLLLTPFYTFACFKYNANTIFLSLWPWTLFAFLKSMQPGKRADAIWFGVLLGLSFLSKYYAVVLAGTCAAASLAHPNRRDYYRSARPWLSLAVCALCFSPHLIWLATTKTAPPVAYAESLVGKGWREAIRYALDFVVATVLYQSLVIAVIAVAALPRRRRAVLAAPDPLLTALAVTPVILTALLGLAFQMKISTNMAVGAYPLLPLLLLDCAPSADERRVRQIAGTAALAITLVPLLACPLLAPLEFRYDTDPAEREPRKELAAVATKLWRERIGTPLKLVAGTDPFENSLTFYSPDSPSSFIDFSFIKAPWVTSRRIARDGLLVECVQADAACHAEAAAFLNSRTGHVRITLVHRFRNLRAPPVTFDLFIIPPEKEARAG